MLFIFQAAQKALVDYKKGKYIDNKKVYVNWHNDQPDELPKDPTKPHGMENSRSM
jgi:hypothetical protein